MARPLQFTDERKLLFLDALARVGTVKGAAAEAGVGTGSVAWAREHDAAFAAEVERVLEPWREARGLASPERGRNALTLPPAAPAGPSLSRDGRGAYLRVNARHDGFTPEKRKRFLKTLAKTGCISDGARVAEISTTTVDRWRRKDACFSRQCEAAIDMAASHIETLAWERAVTGIEEPVWHYGKMVGTRTKRSDAIFRMLLIASNRKKYGRMGEVGRKQLARAEKKRIEQEVRAEWKAKNRMSFEDAMTLLEKKLKVFRARADRGEFPELTRRQAEREAGEAGFEAPYGAPDGEWDGPDE